jgi:MoxR-like ATPase
MPDSEQNLPPFDLIRLPAADHDPEVAQGQLGQRRLPPSLGSHAEAARYYRPSEALLTAINMAIHVGAPLLLTGEPGTGKTQVADFIGEYFGIPVLKFQVKSTSTADDLKYDFDAVGYLHWAQSDKATGPDGQDSARTRRDFLQKRALWEAYECGTESVILIDEIDKAPRDFPNDLLLELDQHRFQHPFDDTEIIEPRCGRPPIVVVTSNDERRLPDAFLRRCIFHRIELTPELIAAAVAAHLQDFPRLDEETRAAARERFWELRESPLDKKPSTAELLVWLCILSAQGTKTEGIRDRPLAELPGISALVKDAQDLLALK